MNNQDYAEAWNAISESLVKRLEERPRLSLRNDIANDVIGKLRSDGWRKPRELTTINELDALDEHAVIRSRTGVVYEASSVSDRRVWFATGAECEDYTGEVTLPAIVLWEPR